MKGAFTFAIQTDQGLVELGYVQAVQSISEPVEANYTDEVKDINTAEFSMEIMLKPQYLRNFRWIAKGEKPWTNSKRKRVYFARRQAKQAAKLEQEKEHADEANAAFFKQQGFNAEGKTWVVLGNTFEVKDQLKEAGCKYTGILGWHTDHQLDGYDMLMLDVSECYDKDYAGIYRWQQWKNDGLEEKIKEANQKAIASRSKSQHVGKAGDRIQIKATLTGFHSYKTQFGDMNIYTFTDIFNNVLVWKTSSYLDRIVGDICKPVQKGEMVELKATVKDHTEYQGIKQTVLTRCKVVT